jgi:hypothetical protein
MARKHRDYLIQEVGMAELPRADVHGNVEVCGRWTRGPCGELYARGFQHPLAQGQDQAGILGQRDELDGRHHAAPRMPPSHQCFGAGHLAGAVDLRLVMQHEFVFAYALPQIGF